MASGETLCRFSPLANEPPSTNFATLDLRNLHPVLDFDPGTNEAAVFSDVMPQNYAGTTGITVFIHYAMTTATTLTIDWDVALERIGDQQQNLDSDGFASPQSVDNTTVAGTAGVVDIVSVGVRDGGQDATGDAELVAVEIRET
jgi:hypothetical protein